MELHDPHWFATELGLPALMEGVAGLHANRPARAVLQGEVPESLEAAAAAIVAIHSADATLLDALARARNGERVSMVLGGRGLSAQGWRVVAAPCGPGYAQLTFAPCDIEQAAAVQRRASLVDAAAAVSHEVANAMSAIKGWAELAVPGAAGETGIAPGEALSLIARCANTAEQAARRMLNLARGDADHDARTDVSELAHEVSDLLTLTARQARVALHAHVEPNLVVTGSRAQLFTVLWNLTKNAIEACGPTGVVKLSLSGDGDSVSAEVRDTGPGLDPKAQRRVFEPYYTTKAGGTGLGLALVHEAVEGLGGRITIDSAPGRGTAFHVTLPRVHRTSHVHSPYPEREHSEEAPISPLVLDARILVVDDDDALREMVATALSLRGARVTTVRSAEEARELEGSYDIALIDMMLNDGRGDELLAQLRKRGTVNAAMLVTGTVQKPRLVPGGEPDDWVRKPFELSHLVDRLRRTLERHEMLSAATGTMRF